MACGSAGLKVSCWFEATTPIFLFPSVHRKHQVLYMRPNSVKNRITKISQTDLKKQPGALSKCVIRTPWRMTFCCKSCGKKNNCTSKSISPAASSRKWGKWSLNTKTNTNLPETTQKSTSLANVALKGEIIYRK